MTYLQNDTLLLSWAVIPPEQKRQKIQEGAAMSHATEEAQSNGTHKLLLHSLHQ